jgi:hypothetical protein
MPKPCLKNLKNLKRITSEEPKEPCLKNLRMSEQEGFESLQDYWGEADLIMKFLILQG